MSIWGFGNGLKKAQKNKNTSCAKPWIHWAARLSRLYLFRQQKTKLRKIFWFCGVFLYFCCKIHSNTSRWENLLLQRQKKRVWRPAFFRFSCSSIAIWAVYWQITRFESYRIQSGLSLFIACQKLTHLEYHLLSAVWKSVRFREKAASMPPGHYGGEKHFSADCGEGNIGFSTPFGAIPSMIKIIGIGQWLLYIISLYAWCVIWLPLLETNDIIWL